MTEYDFTPQDTPPQHEFEEGWYYSRSPKYWFDNGYNQGRRVGYHDAHVDGFQTPRQLHELGFNEGYERGHKDGVSYAMSHINNHTRELSDRIGQLESENDRLYQKLPTQSVEDQKRKSYYEGHIDGYKQGSHHIEEVREYWKGRERDAREKTEQLNEDKEKAWAEVSRGRNKHEEDCNWFWNKINELETELDQNRQDKNRLEERLRNIYHAVTWW